MNASPGAAVGRAVFDWATAVEWAERGEEVILVRKETSPDDLHGMVVARGILTSRGGKTSHAAVVARGMGRTCVCGAEALEVDVHAGRFTVRGGKTVHEGDVISIDGTTGEVFDGAVPVADSLVVQFFEGEQVDDPLVEAVARLMEHADARRRMQVRANADKAEDAARARRFGAQGIGLCRTEHMFLGERRELVENLIVAEDEQGREKALSALLPMQRQDFTEILESMDGLPVTIRLIDPPLHEFLPDLTDLSVTIALADSRGHRKKRQRKLLDAVRRLHEQNPMLGLRGVRLGIVIPGLFTMQARAILEAAAARAKAGGDPRPEIMIPLVASVRELEIVKRRIIDVAREVRDETGVDLAFKVGTMIELPRAAVTADKIADAAEFFSFGTNDLTQMTWGFSRDDVEASFFSTYLAAGRLPGLPVRVPRHRGRRVTGAYGGPAGPRGTPRPAPRRLRRARGRPGVDPLLRRGGAGLRLLLAVPGPGRAPRGRPLRPGWRLSGPAAAPPAPRRPARAPPSASAGAGRSSSSSQAEAIATTGASSTQGTTAADGLRESSELKMP